MAFHGLMIGTDSSEIWAASIYIGSVIMIMLLGIGKGMESASINQNNSVN